MLSHAEKKIGRDSNDGRRMKVMAHRKLINKWRMWQMFSILFIASAASIADGQPEGK